MKYSKNFFIVVVLLSLVFFEGCASVSIMDKKIRTRSSFDFNCAEQSIEVTHIDGRVFGARGCDHQATYIAVGGCHHRFAPCTIILNSPTTGDE